MKVLIACEFSGIVRDAFLSRGHDAISCDLIPSERAGPHIQEDVLEHLDGGWDLMIAFPPCTHLSLAGARYWPEKRAAGKIDEAIDFVRELRNAPIRRIAIENPVGILWSALRRPTQCIEPYWFGHPYRKKTCLWLYNLPRLVPTMMVKPQQSWVSSSKGGKVRDPKKRSLTFRGVAEAMAAQWGCLV